MFRLFALIAGVSLLAACTPTDLDWYDYGYESDWSMEGDGAAMVTDTNGQEVVWVGLGQGSLCGFDVSSGMGMQDTYLDDDRSTRVFAAHAGSVLVSTDGLSVVDMGSGQTTPIPTPGVVVDAQFHGDTMVVLAADCAIDVGETRTKLDGERCGGEILSGGDELLVLEQGVLHRYEDGVFVPGATVIDAAWSSSLGAWLHGEENGVSVVLDGEVLATFEAPGLTDVFALGEYIGFRDADGYVHRIDVDGNVEAGPWIGSTGRLLDTLNPNRVVLERSGVHVKLWNPESVEYAY